MKTSMDVIQFGKWFSERRRNCGWSSQRALAETLRHDPFLQTWHVSEDFIARLEAGRLAFPFRGQVRQQILVLAQVLCKTTREMQAFLRAASLRELSPEETLVMERLHNYLALERVSTIELLPARPAPLLGRDVVLQNFLSHIDSHGCGLYAITGMPGVGKSALAYEVMHRVAYGELRRRFPDGIVTLSCRERRGVPGLLSLLSEVLDIFSPHERRGSRASEDNNNPTETPDLASLIDRVRMVLGQKNVCFLLDDLDPHFLLQEALSALLGYMYPGGSAGNHSSAQRLVLTTSRFIPPAVHLDYHCALEGLDLASACSLFIALVKPAQSGAEQDAAAQSSFSAAEVACIEQICRALGCLPLAIAYAAHAFAVERIPISLLTAQVVMDPLYGLHAIGQQIGAMLDQVLSHFEPEQQRFFALLSLVGKSPFSLEVAATLFLQNGSMGDFHLPLVVGEALAGQSLSAFGTDASSDTTGLPLAALTRTAIVLGRFVSHSLVIRDESQDEDFAHNPHYRLHPMIYACMRQRLPLLDKDLIERARSAILHYAESYLERGEGHLTSLEREQDFLLSMVDMAWQQRRYEQLIRLTIRLFPLIEHLENRQLSCEVVRRAVQASATLSDRYSLSYLKGYLGLLLCYQGRFDEAHACWHEALASADEIEGPPHLWRPYIYMAQLMALRGDISSAYELADTFLQRVTESGDLRSLATAYLKRGSYLRRLQQSDRAYDDLCTALSLIFMLSGQTTASDHLLELEARLELSRVLDDQQSAARYLEAATALAEMSSDPYARALLLLDGLASDAETTVSSSPDATPATPAISVTLSTSTILSTPATSTISSTTSVPVTQALLSLPAPSASSSSSATPNPALTIPDPALATPGPEPVTTETQPSPQPIRG